MNNNYINQYTEDDSNIDTYNIDDKVSVNYDDLSSKLNEIKNAANIIIETVTEAYSSTTKAPSLEPEILSNMLENYKNTFQKIIDAVMEVENAMNEYRKLDVDLSKLADIDLSQLVNKLDMELKSQSITLSDDIIASRDNTIVIDTISKEEEVEAFKPIENQNSFNESGNNSANERRENTSNDENNN